MKQIYKIDTNGYLLEVLIVDTATKIIYPKPTSMDEVTPKPIEKPFVMPKDCIDIKPQDGLHKPQWNGTKWVEGDPSAVLNLAKSIKKQEIKSDLQTYLKSYTLADGTIIKNSIQDQTNSLKNITLSQQALTSPKWTASVDVALNDVVFIGDTLCICTTAGKTGTATPTAPADFGVVVTDNTAGWKKLGFLVNTGKGRVYYTPQDILKISQEVALILNEALTKYDNLKAQIETCTTQADLNKIIW